MSISNLFQPNQYDLFSRTHTVEELIATKISNRLGLSFGLYDPQAAPYATGDIVIYNGCIYKSLVDNNLSVPAYDSPDWIKISNINNGKIFLVNNVVGSDNKAPDQCSVYPFFSLDSAIDQANLINPTGNYTILLEKTGVPYSLSRDLTNDGVSILFLDVQYTYTNSLADSPLIVQVADTSIKISGSSVAFHNIFFDHQDTTDIPMFIVTGKASFTKCNFNRLITVGVGGVIKITTSAAPLRQEPAVFMEHCYAGPANSRRINIIESDATPFGTAFLFMHQISSTGNNFYINETVDPILSAASSVNIRVYGCQNISVVQTHSNVILNNCDVLQYTSTADDPKNIDILGCYWKNSPAPPDVFNKTGTANFRIENTLLPVGYTLADGVTESKYRTSGPQYNYINTTEYNTNDLVIKDGEIYKCLVNNTTNIEPISTSPNWLLKGFHNNRVLFVNNEIGNDTKALTEKWPFFSIDAAIDYGTITFPDQPYMVLIEHTDAINYTLSRNLNKVILFSPNNVYKNPDTIQTVIEVQNEIEFGSDVYFLNLYIITSTTGHTTGYMFKSTSSIQVSAAYFKNCLFNRNTSTASGLFLLGSSTPSSIILSTLVLEKCYSSDDVNNKNKIKCDDGGSSIFLQLYIDGHVESKKGFDIDNTCSGSNKDINLMVLNDANIKFSNNTGGKLKITNSDIKSFVSTANSPSFININESNNINYDSPGNYYSFNKTGTADYQIYNSDIGNIVSLTAGTITSNYEKPVNNYISGKTYNQYDIVNYQGEFYDCRVNGTTGILPNEVNISSWFPLNKVNQFTVWQENALTPAPLSTGLINSADKVTLPALILDPWGFLSTVTANSFRIIYGGIYEVFGNVSADTTATANQDCIIDFFLGSSVDSNISNSYARTTIRRGLVSSVVNYATNNIKGSLILTIPTGSPLLNTDISLYARNTGSQSFNSVITKFSVVRLNKA